LLPPQQQLRRQAANDTAVPLPETMLGDAFVQQARQRPYAPAILTLSGQITYGELLARSAAAASWLTSKGVQRNELVGLITRRGPEQVVGILAIVLAGAAYLPIDAEIPEDRQRYMLEDASVRFILTNVDVSNTREVFRLDTVPVPSSLPPRPLGSTPDDLGYVLYTSGTTGHPKGVMVTHRSVVNVLADCRARFNVVPEDRFFCISAFNFDLSVWDIFGALSEGAAMVMPDFDKAKEVSHWFELSERYGVTIWNSVPAIVQMLADHDNALPSALRLIMMSGDRIPPLLPKALWAINPALRIVSLGGPTETTIWNISHEITASDCESGAIPYGRPTSNNHAWVLDEHGRNCPDWVAGEICAGGTGVTLGYLGDAEKTAQKYYTDAATQLCCFRTGDRGRYLPNGDIEILGRIDHQLKINGYRVESGEIEHHLTAQDEILQAAVVVGNTSNGQNLVAHLVFKEGAELRAETIRERLLASLPDYMIPTSILAHAQLPLNRNQKVDRTALMALKPSAPTRSVEPRQSLDGFEVPLRLIWSKILGIPETDIDVDDNFFALGGTSIAGVRVLTEVRKKFGSAPPLDAIYQRNTLYLLAKEIKNLVTNNKVIG